TPGASLASSYSMVTVDGDGNQSPPTSAEGGGPPAPNVDDSSSEITYSGPWTHTSGTDGPASRTMSTVTSLPCHVACQQFSGTQGQDNWFYETGSAASALPCHQACQEFSDTQGLNGWSYQYTSGGDWTDLPNYIPIGIWDCCGWVAPFGLNDFSGVVS